MFVCCCLLFVGLFVSALFSFVICLFRSCFFLYGLCCLIRHCVCFLYEVYIVSFCIMFVCCCVLSVGLFVSALLSFVLCLFRSLIHTSDFPIDNVASKPNMLKDPTFQHEMLITSRLPVVGVGLLKRPRGNMLC